MYRNLILASLLCFPAIAFAQREYGFDNTKPSGQPYLKPEETLKRMKIADGFEIKLFAAEPMVVNPIAFTIDEKGRVWCIESFEYPKRTPKGQKPRDRIIILEDTDGDGIADKRTVFAEGKDFPLPFDMASGIEVGHGGVFVGAPPYLWFIENKNDKPGKFEVLLKGFGSEDTHETLNTFQWGPDGWLYGLHGVFTNSNVNKPDAQAKDVVKMNAGVWRYHPTTKKFEVFAEGTSNPWGMDWRNTDGQFILCCCVIPHLFHIVPGGIYKRQAGASFNPYAFGEIKEICDHTFHKESGWAHAGLISLDAPHIPKEYQDSVIFGSIHGCSIKRNVLKKNGSTFTASRADDFLVSGDKNFRPLNMKWGPAGDIYLSDWHDQNPCHQTKPDDWDYEHGRIYRIQVKGTKTKKAEDLGQQARAFIDGGENLAAMLADPNPYRARTALRLALELRGEGDKVPDAEVDEFVKHLPKRSGSYATFLANSAGTITRELQKNPQLFVEPSGAFPLKLDTSWKRAWGIRAVCEAKLIPDATINALSQLAERESDSAVRRELASAARRFGPESEKAALSLLHALMSHKEDAADPVIPFMIWLAYERGMRWSIGDELVWLRNNAPGNSLITDHIISRVMRRLVVDREREDLAELLAGCINFASTVEDAAVRKKALEGLSIGLKDRLVDVPVNWNAVRPVLLKDADAETQRYVNLLSVSFRDREALKRAYEIAHDLKRTAEERAEAVRQFTLLRHPEALATLISMTRQEPVLQVRVEAMRSLAMLNAPGIAREVLEFWPKYPPEVRSEAANLLAGRKEWAKQLLDAVGAKKVARTDLTDNTILRISSFRDKNLNEQVTRVWGKMRATPKDLDELINKMRASLYDAPGS
jgi:putative membrane-bound dehydrogenase-like protein